jgi:hypothetical protein
MQVCCQVFRKFAHTLYVLLMEVGGLPSVPSIEVNVECSWISTSVGFQCYISHISKLMVKNMNWCVLSYLNCVMCKEIHS